MNTEEGFAHFIKYNNAVPIVLGALFLMTGATFAASPSAREAVYASESSIASIDTSYLLSANIEKFPFAMRVTAVSEDDSFYYVSYDLDTIGVIEGVWRAVIVGKELRVSKTLLGDGDLEDYIESELAQVRAGELRRLSETQSYERRRGVSEKIVATAYRGLVGDLLKPKEERIPQYVSELSKNDPLYLRDPVELLTFDANARVIIPREEDEQQEEDTRPYPVEEDESQEDFCADIEGIQTDITLCEASEPTEEESDNGGDVPPAEELPAEESPAEESPIVEPPAEGSTAEESPTEEISTQEEDSGEGSIEGEAE